jgi:hypothetical protein
MRSAETSRSAPATDHAGQAGRTVAAAECLSAPSAPRVERTVRLVEGRSASSLPHGDSAHEMVDRTRTSLAQLIRGMLIPPGCRGQPLRGAEDTRHHEALLALLAGDPALGVYSPTPPQFAGLQSVDVSGSPAASSACQSPRSRSPGTTAARHGRYRSLLTSSESGAVSACRWATFQSPSHVGRPASHGERTAAAPG